MPYMTELAPWRLFKPVLGGAALIRAVVLISKQLKTKIQRI